MFTILTGKDLTSAIKGYGKAVATFGEKTHQLAYSALAHVEAHNCASHLNALYSATPLNYRGPLRIWATALGKVSFNATPEEPGAFFAYAKAGKSDLEKALAVSPADFVKDERAKNDKPFDELGALEAFLKRMGEKGASAITTNAIEGAIRLLKGDASTALPAPAKSKRPRIAVSNANVPVEPIATETPQLQLEAA